jgi:cytochrome P450
MSEGNIEKILDQICLKPSPAKRKVSVLGRLPRMKSWLMQLVCQLLLYIHVTLLTNFNAVIVMAGSTSTALCVTFIFWYLCQSPTKLQRLQAEIDTCWDGSKTLEASTLGAGAAPYLNGVIEETLRIWPPAPAGMQRCAPPEGMQVDGKFVPGNTLLSVTPISVQRDSRNFTRGMEWLPERRIEEERPAEWNHDARAFIAFTVGQYTCLGKNLAYQEIRLFVGKVLKNFDVKLRRGLI